MIKEYTSFKDIDRRLKILKLQREIDQESLKLNVQNAKAAVVPTILRTGLGIPFTPNKPLKSVFITFIASKLLDILRNKRSSKKQD